MNYTVVTVIAMPSGKEFDLELPSDLPLQQLSPALLASVGDEIPEEAEPALRLSVSEYGLSWSDIDPGLTLQEAGVVDGMFMRVERV
ncbi:EsaB/YukD family protein [Paenibacillus methanolicus]|uniref:Type VII secretion system (Wss) protein YukD n=1 Tax=Paenibacillus methanolicus TaxID=582686 RepID=A0A5S5BVH7_9BACL|nr:EsaB/YukD family protein [Paenibacillus methanolicus]TYP69603.1 type VII secretion system (Wss) protein YukD [Paenibacillus methanolicus]